jgi:hypothetical protein
MYDPGVGEPQATSRPTPFDGDLLVGMSEALLSRTRSPEALARIVTVAL